jgi:hypothetical protein
VVPIVVTRFFACGRDAAASRHVGRDERGISWNVFAHEARKDPAVEIVIAAWRRPDHEPDLLSLVEVGDRIGQSRCGPADQDGRNSCAQCLYHHRPPGKAMAHYPTPCRSPQWLQSLPASRLSKEKFALHARHGSADARIHVMAVEHDIPRVTKVRPGSGRILRVRFAGDRQDLAIDMTGLIARSMHFAPLIHDDTSFTKAVIVEDGLGVAWPIQTKWGPLDVSASTLRRIAEEQQPIDVRQWLTSLTRPSSMSPCAMVISSFKRCIEAMEVSVEFSCVTVYTTSVAGRSPSYTRMRQPSLNAAARTLRSRPAN